MRYPKWGYIAPASLDPIVTLAAATTTGGSFTPDKLTITFSLQAGGSPILPSSSATGFTLTLTGPDGSGDVAIGSSSRPTSNTIAFVIATTIYQGDTLVLSYVPGNVVDTAGRTLKAFSISCSNDSGQPRPPPP